MGVDHGLGGNNSEKSRKRRTKKAKQVATIAKAAMNKKKEVVFDDESRVNYLTGFRKRKQERREYGHAMEILKTHKKKLDKRREIRTAVTTALTEQKKNMKKAGKEESDDEDDNNSSEEEEKISGTATFADEATTSMFGGVVDVVIDTGIAEEMDRNFQESITGKIKEQSLKNTKKEPTRLEKALSKARQNLSNAPKKKKSVKKNADASELLNKAIGGARSRGAKKDKKGKKASEFRGGKGGKGRGKK